MSRDRNEKGDTLMMSPFFILKRRVDSDELAQDLKVWLPIVDDQPVDGLVYLVVG